MKNIQTKEEYAELKVGDKVKVGRTIYEILGSFVDNNELFYMTKYLVQVLYRQYCAIGWSKTYNKVLRHS